MTTPDLTNVGIRNRPLVASMLTALDLVAASASALPDNVYEDGAHIPADVAHILLQQVAQIQMYIRAASPPPPQFLPEGFRLPTQLDRVTP